MLFSIILSFLLLSTDVTQNTDCDDVEITFQTTNVTATNQGSVSVEVEGSVKGPVYYVFYYTSGHLVNEDVTKSSINNLKSGKYYCSVVYNSGCTQKIEFEIKENGGQ